MQTPVDFFVCHASEDKPTFVRPFANFLIKNGATIFYDEFSIKIGDSLSEKINGGLAVSKVAIVVLSEHFFAKPWTNAELQGIFQRHIAKKTKLLIIYHEITHEEVLSRLPLLADIYAADSSVELHELCRQVFEASNFTPSLKYLRTDIGSNGFSEIATEGFSLSVFFSMNVLGDGYIDKFIAEFGDDSCAFGRVAIRVKENAMIIAEVINKFGVSLSLRTDLGPFLKGPCMLTFQVAAKNESIELYVDGVKVNYLDHVPRVFFDAVSLRGQGILFNSFDLVHPLRSNDAHICSRQGINTGSSVQHV